MPGEDSVQTVWEETRAFGLIRASVVARMVPSSGVGWVDLRLEDEHFPTQLPPHLAKPRRVLADWSGMPPAEAVRGVIKLTDDWFTWCGEQVERERVVAALAASGETPLPEAGPARQDAMRKAMFRAMQNRQKGSVDPFDMGDDPLDDILGIRGPQ